MADEQSSFIDQFRRDAEAWHQDHLPTRLYTGDQLAQLKEYVRVNSITEAEWQFFEAIMKNDALHNLWWWFRSELRSPMGTMSAFCGILLKEMDGSLTSRQRADIEAIQGFADYAHTMTFIDTFLAKYWEDTGSGSK
jgi:hypothetical protein